MDLSKETKESLYQHIEAIEDERETIINLLNMAIETCCPNSGYGCPYSSYCNIGE